MFGFEESSNWKGMKRKPTAHAREKKWRDILRFERVQQGVLSTSSPKSLTTSKKLLPLVFSFLFQHNKLSPGNAWIHGSRKSIKRLPWTGESRKIQPTVGPKKLDSFQSSNKEGCTPGTPNNVPPLYLAGVLGWDSCRWTKTQLST